MSEAGGDLSNKAQLRARREKDAREQRRQENDLRAVLATESGRRFVWRLIDAITNSFAASFAGESTHTTAYNEGVRAVGIGVRGEAQRVAPMEYVQMQAERLEEQRTAALTQTRGRLDQTEPEDEPDLGDDS